jgi:rhodanese-related sulfurtransferase
MSDAIGIGFFQVDNLIRNRVPLNLFLMDVSLEGIFVGPELGHIQRYGSELRPDVQLDSVHNLIKARQSRLMDPVLVICKDGRESKKIADQLGAHGYINCYFVEGGLSHLQQSFHELKSSST